MPEEVSKKDPNPESWMKEFGISTISFYDRGMDFRPASQRFVPQVQYEVNWTRPTFEDIYDELEKFTGKIEFRPEVREYFRKMRQADPFDFSGITLTQQFGKQAAQLEDLRLLAEFRKDLPMLGTEEIENRVGFHKATIEGANATLPKHAHLRRLFKQVMTELDKVLPEGRARMIALERIEDASMWSHKSVAELAPLVPETESQDTAALEREPVNVDTPVLETPSSTEMRAWITNHFGHIHGLANLPDNSDLAFARWLLDQNHISEDQFAVAYPGFEA